MAKLYFGHTLTPSLPQIWAELLNSYYLTFGNGLVRHLARSLPQFWAEFLNWSRNYNFRSPTISIFFSGECGSHCNIHLCHFLPKFVAIFLSQICSHYLPIFEGILPPDWSNFVRSHFTVKFQADLSEGTFKVIKAGREREREIERQNKIRTKSFVNKNTKSQHSLSKACKKDKI